MCQLRRNEAMHSSGPDEILAMTSSHETPNAVRPTTHLRRLINRTDRVLSVLHPPNAACARIMEKAGCEVGFVGTGGVVGAYTGLADVGSYHVGVHDCRGVDRSP
jgi:2-methylisocitrate lyase-like PEP mutase family enzyme